ncbi:helix-turn-helix transcriptional regulator [Paenarthrobacter ureafaciens]
MTQARQLRGLTKHALGEAVGVSGAAVGQYEAGVTPRPEMIGLLGPRDSLGATSTTDMTKKKVRPGNWCRA